MFAKYLRNFTKVCCFSPNSSRQFTGIAENPKVRLLPEVVASLLEKQCRNPFRLASPARGSFLSLPRAGPSTGKLTAHCICSPTRFIVLIAPRGPTSKEANQLFIFEMKHFCNNYFGNFWKCCPRVCNLPAKLFEYSICFCIF